MNEVFAGLIILCVVAGLFYLAALAVGLAVETHLREKEGTEHLDQRLRAGASLFRKLESRCQEIMPQVARLDGSLKSMQRRSYMAAKRVADLAAKREQLIRVLGEEDAFVRPERPARLYIAEVINRHIQRALLDQKTVAGISTAWGRVQSVQVWASNIGAAKSLVEAYYPHSTGFHIIELREPSDEAGFEEGLPEIDAGMADGAMEAMGGDGVPVGLSPLTDDAAPARLAAAG